MSFLESTFRSAKGDCEEESSATSGVLGFLSAIVLVVQLIMNIANNNNNNKNDNNNNNNSETLKDFSKNYAFIDLVSRQQQPEHAGQPVGGPQRV